METITHITDTATGGVQVEQSQTDANRGEKGGGEEEFYDAIDDDRSIQSIDSESSETQYNMGRKNRSEISPSSDVLSDDKCNLNNNTKTNSNSDSREDLFIGKNNNSKSDRISKQRDVVADSSHVTMATGAVETEKVLGKREKRKRDRKKRKKNRQKERESNEDGDEKENSLQKFDSSETDVSEKDEVNRDRGQKVGARKRSYDVSGPVAVETDVAVERERNDLGDVTADKERNDVCDVAVEKAGSNVAMEKKGSDIGDVAMEKEGSDVGDVDSSDQLVSTSSDLRTESREISSDSDLVKSDSSSGNEESYEVNCDDGGIVGNTSNVKCDKGENVGNENIVKPRNVESNKSKDSKQSETDNPTVDSGTKTEKQQNDSKKNKNKNIKKQEKVEEKHSSTDDLTEKKDVETEKGGITPTGTPGKKQKSRRSKNSRKRSNSREDCLDENKVRPDENDAISEDVDKKDAAKDKDSSLNEGIPSQQSVEDVSKASKTESLTDKGSKDSNLAENNYSKDTNGSRNDSESKESIPESKEASSKRKDSFSDNRSCSTERKKHKGATPESQGPQHQQSKSSKKKDNAASRRKNRKNKDKRSDTKPQADLTGGELSIVDSGGTVGSIKGSQEESAVAEAKKLRFESNQELSTNLEAVRSESGKNEQNAAETSGTNVDQKKVFSPQSPEKKAAEQKKVKTEEFQDEKKDARPQGTSEHQSENKDKSKELFEGEGEAEGSSVDPLPSVPGAENPEGECEKSETKDKDSSDFLLKEVQNPEEGSVDDNKQHQKSNEDSTNPEQAAISEAAISEAATEESIIPAVHAASETDAIPKTQGATNPGSPEVDSVKPQDTTEQALVEVASHKETVDDIKDSESSKQVLVDIAEPSPTGEDGQMKLETPLVASVPKNEDAVASESVDNTDSAKLESGEKKGSSTAEKESVEDKIMDSTDCMKIESRENKESVEVRILETVEAIPAVSAVEPEKAEARQTASLGVEEGSSEQVSQDSTASCNVEKKEPKWLPSEVENSRATASLDKSSTVESVQAPAVVDGKEDSVHGGEESGGAGPKDMNDDSSEKETSLSKKVEGSSEQDSSLTGNNEACIQPALIDNTESVSLGPNEEPHEQEAPVSGVEPLQSSGIMDGGSNTASSGIMDGGEVKKEKVLESSEESTRIETVGEETQDCVDGAPTSGASPKTDISDPKSLLDSVERATSQGSPAESEIPKSLKDTEDSVDKSTSKESQNPKSQMEPVDCVDRAPISGPCSAADIIKDSNTTVQKDNKGDLDEVMALCNTGAIKDISVTKEMKDVAMETEEDEEKMKMKEEMEKLREEVESTKAALKKSQSHLYRHQIHTNLTITSLQAQLRKKDLEMKTKQVVHDNQISAIISKLFLLEGQLRQEQKQILGLLELKETVIDKQSEKIEDLTARNDKLSMALKLHNNGSNGIVQSINRSASDLSPTNHKLFKEKDSPKNIKFWGSMKDKLRRHKSSFELHTPDRLEPLGEGTFRYGSQENLSNISRRQRINDRKERCRSIAEYPQGLGQSPLLELPNENDFQKCDSAEAIIIHTESPEETGTNSSDDSHSQFTDTMGSNVDVRERSSSFASQKSDQSSLNIPADAEIVNVDKQTVQSSPTLPSMHHSESNPFKSIKTMLKRKGSKLRSKKKAVNLQTGANQEPSNDSVKKHFKKFDMQ